MYQGYKHIIVEKQDKILVIKFYNPKKKNCLSTVAYQEIGGVFNQVAKDETVTVVVVTGEGEFFTAGNDLSQAPVTDDVENLLKENNRVFLNMVTSIIECPKIIIALVNGPSIGIGATIAGLCDVCWCSDTAYFLTPFTKLGIAPEACSSYLFPLIMGRSKASEMLYFSGKMTAEEAYHFNFASKIFKLSDLNTTIWPQIREFAELPPISMQATKQLSRIHEKDSLIKALNAECEELAKRFLSEEFFNALMQFATRKSKL